MPSLYGLPPVVLESWAALSPSTCQPSHCFLFPPREGVCVCVLVFPVHYITDLASANSGEYIVASETGRKIVSIALKVEALQVEKPDFKPRPYDFPL